MKIYDKDGNEIPQVEGVIVKYSTGARVFEQNIAYPQYGQGNSTPASDEDIQRDDLGYTNPNLHRRVDPKFPVEADDATDYELTPRDYLIGIQAVNSYRTTIKTEHIDYQDIDKIARELGYSEGSEEYQALVERVEASEELEIP